MSLSLSRMESIIERCKDAKNANFEGITNGMLVFKDPKRGNTSCTQLSRGWTEEEALGLFGHDEDHLTDAVRKAYVRSIATLSPAIRTVTYAAPLPEPDVAVKAIQTKAESAGVNLDELIAGFRLQLIPTLQGLEFDRILNTFAPRKGPGSHFIAHMGSGGPPPEGKNGSIRNWRWSWTELSPRKIPTTRVDGISPSPMQWVDKDDMAMLTAQAMEGDLTIADLPYNRNQLRSMHLITRADLIMRGILGHPHTLVQDANGQKHFVYVDPWNGSLVEAAQCPNRTVQVRRAFKGSF